MGCRIQDDSYTYAVLEPWAERIPQAIEKAEEVLLALPPHSSAGDEVRWYGSYQIDGKTLSQVVTREEVALAKALWELHDGDDENCPAKSNGVCNSLEALRAFCEKVEAL